MFEIPKPLELPHSQAPVAVTPIEDDDDTIRLRREIAELKEQEAELESATEEEDQEVARIREEMDKIRLETQAILARMVQQQAEINDRIRRDKEEKRRIKREAERKQQQLDLLEQEKRARQALHDNLTLFDSITAGLPWRELAYGYQLDGAKLMAQNKRAINADEMGLGKTLQALMACDMLQAQKVLVVCPSDLIANWEKEAARWAPNRLVAPFYRLDKNTRDAQFWLMENLDQFIVLINYEAWRMDEGLVDKLVRLNFDTVILDEAHNIKNTKTEAYRGVRKIVMSENACPFCSARPEDVEIEPLHYKKVCPRCGWDSMVNRNYTIADRRSVKNVFPMTGTPILNKPQELYPLLHLILPEGFVNERVFLDLYCEQDRDTNYWKFRPGGVDRLANSLRGRYIARKSDDAEVNLGLPEQTVKIHEIDFDEQKYPDQARVMAQLKRHAAILLKSGKAVVAPVIITLILRQRQACVWPGGIQVRDAQTKQVIIDVSEEVQESVKVDYAMDLIKEHIANGKRVVLFSQFKSPLRVIAQRLADNNITAAVLDGDTPEYMRSRIKVDVDVTRTPISESKFQVVLCNYATGGVGLDFTGMQQVVILDDPWNPGTASQAWRRVKRIGQTQKTGVDIIRVKGTIDTWLAKLIEFKSDMVDGFDTMTRDLQELLIQAIDGDEF